MNDVVPRAVALALHRLVQRRVECAHVFVLPVVMGYVFFRDVLSIRSLDLSHLVFDPVRMTLGFLIMLGRFALYITTLVAVGAAMPTAKDAGGFIGVMVALMFVPL